MRTRRRLLAAVLAAACSLGPALAWGGKQVVAFFPLQNLADNTISTEVTRLGQTIREKLQDRFDIQPVSVDGADDDTARKRKALGVGATYILTGAVSRIGRTATLDLTLAAPEDPGKGRTVVVTGSGDVLPGGSSLSPVFTRMAIEATYKLKYLFFGDELVGEGAARHKITRISGAVSRSRTIPGEIVSIARSDTDRDGKTEIVAATTDGIAVYAVEGDDLVEKARLPDPGTGFIHVDAADINRNGTADIIAVRYGAGKAVSDIWEFDGKQYRRLTRDIPYFLRTVDMGKEGIVLVGQESDPSEIYKGPIFRLALGQYGTGGGKERGPLLPLPEGTWIYSFSTLKAGDRLRYVTLGERDRLILLDDSGKKLWESIDGVSGTETALDAPVASPEGMSLQAGTKRLYLPNRMFGIDLDGDKNDELVVLNNLVTSGGFFENIRVFSNAEVLCFAQNGDSLQFAWRSVQAGNSARDAFLEFSPATKSLRIGMASLDKGKILGKFGEWRLLWFK